MSRDLNVVSFIKKYMIKVQANNFFPTLNLVVHQMLINMVLNYLCWENIG